MARYVQRRPWGHETAGKVHFLRKIVIEETYVEDVLGRMSMRSRRENLGPTLCGLEFYSPKQLDSFKKEDLCKTCLKIYTGIYADK